MKSKNRAGYGTFPLASVFGKVSKFEAKKALETFLDNGGCFIDTAQLYGFGEVEKLLGEVLRNYSREEYFIITKVGFDDVEGKNFSTVRKSGKSENIKKQFEESLDRIKLDFVDLLMVHSPDYKTDFSETMKTLEEIEKFEQA